MANADAPPFPGNWHFEELANNGAWTLGPVWQDRAQGKYCMRVEPRHCNAFGVMHGGAMATFADAQLAVLHDYTGVEADHTPTVTLSVDYIGRVPQGSWVMTTAGVLRTTRTLIFTQALITVDDEIVARSNAIYRNVRNKGG